MANPPSPLNNKELSRRDLLSGGFLKSLLRPLVRRATAPLARSTTAFAAFQAPAPPKPVNTARAPRVLPILRPPGAISENDFLDGCTRCGDCITACPYQAIVQAPAKFRHAAGTPMVDPSLNACHVCTDTPCITSCKPQVLQRKDDAFPIMGKAQVSTFDCLAHQGSTCSSCRERCPVPDAIVINNGRPTVAQEHCVGCGVCQAVCPAPRNAILLMPRLDRPKAQHD